MSNRRRLVIVALALAALSLCAFRSVVRHDFTTFDDDVYVTDNPAVQAGLTREGLAWAFGEHAANWHPLTWLSHMADVELFGLRPAGHHAMSLLLHVVNVVLTLMVLRMLTGRLWAAALVAALFGMHPLRVESVAWVAERKDVLSGLLALLTLGAYGRYVRRPRNGRYLVVILAFALGLMAKPMLVTLPFVLVLLDYWPLGRFDRLSVRTVTQSLLRKTPLLVLGAVSAIVTYHAQMKGGTIPSSELLSVWARVANAAISYARYVLKTIWPQGLSAYYPYRAGSHPEWLLTVILGLGAATAVCLWAARRRPYLAVGWLWFLGTLVPVIGLVQVGAQSMADRYTYLPLVGLFVAGVWGGSDLLARHRPLRPAVILATSSVLAVLVAMTWLQVGQWRDTTTLFRHAVDVDPNNDLAHVNLGVALFSSGQTQEAIRHFREALRVDPLAADAHNDLGVALIQQGKTEEALEHFREALHICPNFADATENTGLALASRGDETAAAQYRSRAARLRAQGDDRCAVR